MTARQHLDLVGLFYILYGGMTLAVGALVFVIFGLGGIGMGLAGAGGGDEELLIMSGIYGMAAVFTGLIVAVFGLPYVIVGFGMRRRKPWSRVAGLVLGALALMNLPLGTLLGVYGIVKLVDDDVRALLDSGDPDVLA
jgi:hypothetical protein